MFLVKKLSEMVEVGWPLNQILPTLNRFVSSPLDDEAHFDHVRVLRVQ